MKKLISAIAGAAIIVIATVGCAIEASDQQFEPQTGYGTTRCHPTNLVPNAIQERTWVYSTSSEGVFTAPFQGPWTIRFWGIEIPQEATQQAETAITQMVPNSNPVDYWITDDPKAGIFEYRGSTVNAVLLASGMARVDSTLQDIPACFEQAQKEARRAKRGTWR